MASDQRLAWLVVTVSLWTPIAALARYSEAKPLLASLTRLVYVPAGVNVCPPAILNPSLVITSSLAWVVAPAVAITAVVVATGRVVVPVWSSGATAAAPDHSDILRATSLCAGA